ncbi:histidine phosphatase family protein [Janthinobacterium sp. SUN206]|nr:histidine phosphatase family protein [Janthinobacterium sp. SUN206]MDO8067600.1 histidine phosphatase family protein [Janthinobacterium sp. SUN206]
MLYSPYMRVQRTAQAVLARIGADSLPCVVADERLREREFGILDRWKRPAHKSRPSPTCRPRRNPERGVITA